MRKAHREEKKTIRAEHNATEKVSDEMLLQKYRRTGDEACFATLVRRYERELYNYLRRFLGDASMAEDAFQATFLQIHLKCSSFDVNRRFRPWLYTVATNQAIDAQRRNKRHKHMSLHREQGSGQQELGVLIDLLEAGDRDPTERMEESEWAEWIGRAVTKLPEQLRSAVQLVYFRGLKYREAADILDVPVGTVKSRLHSAVSKLRQSWRQAHASHVPL